VKNHSHNIISVNHGSKAVLDQVLHASQPCNYLGYIHLHRCLNEDSRMNLFTRLRTLSCSKAIALRD